MRFPSLILAILLPLVPAAAQQPGQVLSPAQSAAWREDLKVLATELPRRHKNFFYRLQPAAFDSAVAGLDARIPGLRRQDVIVGFMRLVAMGRDGHTSLNPMFSPLGFHYYPVEFYVFKDGLFIRRAAPEYRTLAGARVRRIGRVSADSALMAVAPVISHENHQLLKAFAPFYLAIPEVLDALGLADGSDSVSLEIEAGGRPRRVWLRPAGPLVPQGHNPDGAVDKSGWVDMRDTAGRAPLYLRHPGEPYWREYLPESRTLYISYRAVFSRPDYPLPQFFADVFARVDSGGVDHLVVDVRDNLGGNGFYNRPLLMGILRRPTLDRPGGVFVITGRRTYSAAMNLVNELETYSNATFAGEPTGSPPNFFGDHEPLTLPNSGLALNISTLWWQTANPRDQRPFIAPGIYAETGSEDYRTNLDPVMAAILRRITQPALAHRLAGLVGRGDTASAERALRDARQDEVNRFRNLEAEVNALGYQLLGAGKTREAVLVFGLNTRVYHGSANVWDSLGEGLERWGRREQAVRAYRKALEIDPHTATSRAALERLTGTGH
ncbi:MAG: hypothetical protein AB7I33_11005 [Gemmatimonadales bacterium]